MYFFFLSLFTSVSDVIGILSEFYSSHISIYRQLLAPLLLGNATLYVQYSNYVILQQTGDGGKCSSRVNTRQDITLRLPHSLLMLLLFSHLPPQRIAHTLTHTPMYFTVMVLCFTPAQMLSTCCTN